MKSYIVAIFMAILVFGCIGAEKPSENISNDTFEIPEPDCIDSDGLDESTQGTVTFNSTEYQDSCDDGSTVKEYFCDGNSLEIKQIPCKETEECISGKCVKKEEPEPAPEPKCIETDSGSDYYNYGSVNYNGQLYHDVCQGNYDLLEYYCDNDELKQTTHHCSTGERCEEGECVGLDKTCEETDANDQTLYGTVTQYGGGMVISSEYDSCIDEQTRLEFYCESGEIMNKTELCSSDTYCYNGVCRAICQDNDEGENYFVASSASEKTEVFADYCMDENTLIEYYCSGNVLLESSQNCDYCLEGRCVKPSDIKCKEYAKSTQLTVDSELIEEKNDTCSGTKLRDYFCFENEIDYVNEVCEDLCINAECVEITEEACFDLDISDPKGSSHVASSIILTTNTSVKDTREDYCLNDITLVEYLCDGTGFETEYVTCSGDEKCVDGACIYPYTCTETDGGQSIVPGEASIWDGDTLIRTENDACMGDGRVFDAYCSDGRVKFIALDCPDGLSCNSETRQCE